MVDLPSTPGWFPVLTLLIGYGTKSLSDWLLNKRALEREREAREAARIEKRYERRSAFQRETLLSLQDAIQKLGRATGQVNYHDEIAFRDTKTWRKNFLPSDLDEGYRVAQTQAALLSSRVRSDDVRQLVSAFKTASVKVIHSANQIDASQALMECVALDENLHARIGELIRKIDDEDAE